MTPDPAAPETDLVADVGPLLAELRSLYFELFKAVVADANDTPKESK